MNKEIRLMHAVWDDLTVAGRKATHLPVINYDEIISSMFSTGPFYSYVIDFFDFSVSHVSPGMQAAHGVAAGDIRHINDILSLVHPDDMEFAARAEKKAFDLLYNEIGRDKILLYKVSYNLRFKSASGEYKMFNHQSLVLTVDEKDNFVKALNIHTDISHLTGELNYNLALIGLSGEPSYLKIDMGEPSVAISITPANIFSRREIEIVRMLARGHGSKVIAQKLYISEETVKTHRKNINRKSGCRNAAELAVKGLSEGWL